MWVVLAQGDYALEKDIELQCYQEYHSVCSSFMNIPKPLLYLDHHTSLSYVYEAYKQYSMADPCYLIVNANNFKYYERWAMHQGFDMHHVWNTSSTHDGVTRGTFIKTLLFLPRPTTSLLLLSAHFLYEPDTCPIELHDLLFNTTSGTSRVCLDELQCQITYQMNEQGVRVIQSIESMPSETPIVLRLAAHDVTHLYDIIDTIVSPCDYKEWLNRLCQRIPLVWVKAPIESMAFKWSRCTRAQDYLQEYRYYSPLRSLPIPPIPQDKIQHQTYARIGLMGNPSDGFYGKTLSMLISQFWAQVTLVPHSQPKDTRILFERNFVLDPSVFESHDEISHVVGLDGYQGATVLFLALIRVFVQWCRTHEIPLKKQGYRVFCTTNIPRQVGLSGSSALVVALLKCLLQFHAISHTQMPLHVQSEIALRAERDELGISAGYQDRVVQCYEQNLIYMDFNENIMKTRGYGEYSPLPYWSGFEGLWLAYVPVPKNSGKVHNNVKSRWEAGETRVVEAMKMFASFTEKAKHCIESNDCLGFAQLMDDNFNLRQQLYGDAVIGQAGLKMVAIGRKHGFAVKFCGSGGAVVGLWKNSSMESEKEALIKVERDMRLEGKL